jgi:hypothetical protein
MSILYHDEGEAMSEPTEEDVIQKVKNSAARIMQGEGGTLVVGLGTTIALYLLEAFLIFVVPEVGGVFLLAFAFVGWKYLNRIQPTVFLILPVVGWIIYFVVKFFLSCFVGLIATPLWLGGYAASLADAQKR